MSKKSGDFKRALSLATSDRSQEVFAAAQQAQAILGSVDQQRLDPSGQSEHHAVARDLDATVQQFRATQQDRGPQAAKGARTLKNANAIRLLALFVLLIVAIILLFKSWVAGIVLAVVAIVGSIIAMSVMRKKAQQLARNATGPANQTLNTIGRPVQGAKQATGLCARADTLYLHSLDQNALVIEQQRRQMEAMQAQHEAHLAQQQEVIRRQQEGMDRMVEEQEATNDALYGKPGFLGSAMRAHDKAKQDQRK